MRYEHTQTAPLYLCLVVIAVGTCVAAWFAPELAVQIILVVTGVLMMGLACCFRQLTVRDDGDHLLICFGPLPLFHRRLAYADIEVVAQGRSTIFDGWGIHLTPGGGWTWNLWGFNCVNVTYRKGAKLRRIRIGTDDPAGLAAFLSEKQNSPGI